MKTKECLYKENFKSGLGLFELRIDSTGQLLSVESMKLATLIRSTGYDIVIKRVAAPTSWLPANMSVEITEAWLFYITKRNVVQEKLTICFGLPDKKPPIQTGPDTGQWLTAVEFEDSLRQVHIGSLDEEWFAWYGKAAWTPQRLVPVLRSDALSITVIEEKGLRTSLPELLINERFYLHYILAESPRRKSEEYPDEWDVSTWYAVDQTQTLLEDAWNKQAGEIQ
jgi:hypothetical protein